MVKLKQYNPNKHAKYGLLYWSISDSVVPYTYFTLPYVGKPEIKGSEFYVTGTDEYSVYLVDKLSSHVDITAEMCQWIAILLVWQLLIIWKKRKWC